MTDIFDTLELKSIEKTPSGDIFDQVAVESPTMTAAKTAISELEKEKRGWPTLAETDPFYHDQLAKLSPEQRQEYFKSKGPIGMGEKIASREVNLSTLMPFVSSVDNMLQDKPVIDAANRLQSGQGTDEDKRTLRNYALRQEEKLARGETLPTAVLDTLANMVPFATEIGLTGGVAAGGRAMAAAASRRMLVRAMGKRVGGFASRELATIGAAGGYTAANPQRIAENYMERTMPKVNIDETGELRINPEARGTALDFLKSIGETALSFYTEQQGEKLVKGGKWALDKLTGGRAGKILGTISEAISRRIGRTPDEIVTLMKAGKYSGILGEMGEEQLEKTLREVMLFNDTSDDENSTYWERVARTLKPDARELLTQFIAFSIPGMAGRGVGYALKTAKTFLRPEAPESIPDISAALAIKNEIIADTSIPAPQKEAALAYIGDIETEIVNEVVDLFPDPVNDQTSLERIGNALAAHLGVSDKIKWIWDTKKVKRNLGHHIKHKDGSHTIQIRGGNAAHSNRRELMDTIVHEIGHIAIPPVVTGGWIRQADGTQLYSGRRTRRAHTKEFKDWVKKGVEGIYETRQRKIPKPGSERFAGPVTPKITTPVDSIPGPTGVAVTAPVSKKYTGPAYRVETGSELRPEAKTAADVVRFEQEELGNDLGVFPEKLVELEKIPATEIIWVTRDREQAARYAEDDIEAVEDYTKIVSGGEIISDIGADGVLVLKPKKGAANALPEKVQTQEIIPGSQTTPSAQTYPEASKNQGNVWVRDSKAPASNEGRTLLVQFSSDLLTAGQEDPKAREYYDKLHTVRPGYTIPGDFWELPTWIGQMAASLPNSDVYVIRDITEAIKFFNEAGYDTIAFSSLDVNKEFIMQIAENYSGDIAVGGYADKDTFDPYGHVTWYDDMKSMVKSKGGTFQDGVDYRHFLGSKTQPRLCLSKGCLHKCAFCSIPKGITPATEESIESQLKAMENLDFELVYLDDKTFGQADNYKKLPEIYKRLKKTNPNFKGFIIQTTAQRFNKFDDAFLKESGIKYVELGVESYNNEILKKLHKPASEKLIDKSVEKLRANKLNFIPNVIIGLPDETAETYQHTLDFIKKNSDIISHINVYNLALYKGTEMGDSITAQNAEDVNENQVTKSFHKNPETVLRFATDIYDLGIELLDKTPYKADKETGEEKRGITRKQALAMGHKIPAMLDWDEDQRRQFMRETTGKESMKDMTLDEMRTLVEALKQKAQEAGIPIELPESNLDELLATLAKKPTVTPSPKEVLTESSFRKLIYTAKTWVFNYFQRQAKMERILTKLDGGKKGVFGNTFFRPLMEADLMANEVTGRDQMEFIEELNRLKIDAKQWMMKKIQVPGTELKLTPFDKIGIVALSKNKKSYKYLISMGFTPTEIQAIRDSLTPAEKAIMEFGMNKFDAQWPLLKQVAVLVGFNPDSLKKEFDYVPIVRTDRELEEQEDFFDDLIDEMMGEAAAAPESGMLIKRKPRALGKLETNFAMLYFYNARRVNRFLNMAPIAKQLSPILNSKKFKAALNSKTYDKGVELLKTWVKDSIKGAAIRDMSWLERFAETLRKRAVIYALGHNILARTRQGLGLFTAMSTYPKMIPLISKNIVLSSRPKGHKDLEDFVYEKSLMMKQRDYDRDIRLALSQEAVTRRLKGKSLSPKSLEGIATTDKFIASIAWKSFYDYEMGISGDEAKAIDFADEHVRKTQAMAAVVHLPAFYRGGELERMLTTFQTELATIGNYWAYDILGAKKRGEISWKLASYRTLVSYVIPALLFGMINRARLPEDWKEIGFDLATYPIAPFLFFGQLIQRIITGIESGIIGTAGFEALVKVASDVRKMAGYDNLSRKEKDELLRKAAVDVAKVYGAFTGKVTIQELRTAEGVLDLIEGKTDDWRRLVWSKWSLEHDTRDKADKIMRR